MCSSLSTITKSCNPIIPGIVKAWICDYSNLISFTTYETHIQSITFSNTLFELPSLKSTTIFDLSIERDFQRGLIKKTSNFSFSLGELSVVNREFIKSLLFKRVVVIIYVNDDYYILGLNGTLKLDSWNASSGKSQNDFNGYNLNFIDNIHTYGNKKYPYYHINIAMVADLINMPLAGTKEIVVSMSVLGMTYSTYAYVDIFVDNVPIYNVYIDKDNNEKFEVLYVNKGDTIKIVVNDYDVVGSVEISIELKDDNDNTRDSKSTTSNTLTYEIDYDNINVLDRINVYLTQN